MKKLDQKIDFIFLIHPRSREDVLRKYPVFKFIPNRLMELALLFWPSIFVDRLSGIKSVKGGRELTGVLMGISMTPSMMMKYPGLVKRKIAKTIRRAAKMGATIVGLGGWIPLYSSYGLDATSPNGPGITTGHSYAAWTIAWYVEDAIFGKSECKNKPVVAVLGAAGSTGALVVALLAERRLETRILLVDLPRKQQRLNALAEMCRRRGSEDTEVALDPSSLKEADIVVVVSSSRRCILSPEHVKEGAVIIDDTQPRNTSERLLGKAKVVDVLSEVPGLTYSFDLGLVRERPEITFTCLAEVAVLAAHGWDKDFTIGMADISKVEEISKMAEVVGVKPALGVSFGKLHSESR